MLKKIRAERMISILLIILTIFSFACWNSYIASADRATALTAGKDLYGSGQVCACPSKYTLVLPKKDTNNDKVTSMEVVYSTVDNTKISGYCQYSTPSITGTNISSTVNVSCTGVSGEKLMKKYIDAGLMELDDAKKFVNDASVYASYVQQNLSTKTQARNSGNLKDRNNFSDLGNGRFQRAMFEFNNNAHFVYSFLIGFAFITSMFVFIMIFMKITWLPDHPIKRREAMEDIVTSGISVVLTGGIWIVISLFQSIFDKFWSTYAVYSKDWKTVGNMFLYEYKGIVIGVLGIAALTALLMLIKNFVGLSFSGDNPSARKQKMISILLCGIATAGLGGLAVFMGFFWDLLR